LPALHFRLEHQSEVTEAGQPRQVNMAIRAVAFGSLAETLGKQAIGSSWKFTGFLATPRNGKHPVLHIQSFVIQD
jgi:primosomal replication protein N